MKCGLFFVMLAIFTINNAVAGSGSPFSTHFGFHFGLTSGGMNPRSAADNPLVFVSRKDELQTGWGRNLGLSIEQLHWSYKSGESKPVWGFRIGFMANTTDQQYVSAITAGYKYTYLRVPVDFMFCVFSKKAYLRDDDEIRVSGDNITFHKGVGVIQTRSSVFVHGGISYGSLRNISYESGTYFGPDYNDSFRIAKKDLYTKDPAFQLGLEFRTSNIGLQIYYQESLKSIYKGYDIKQSMFGVLLKLVL